MPSASHAPSKSLAVRVYGGSQILRALLLLLLSVLALRVANAVGSTFHQDHRGGLESLERNLPQPPRHQTETRNTRQLSASLLGTLVSNPQEASETDSETDEQIARTERELLRFQRLEALSEQKLELLRNLKELETTRIETENAIEDPDNNESQIKNLERQQYESEVLIETQEAKLEILEQRFELEELSFAAEPPSVELTDHATEILERLAQQELLLDQIKTSRLEQNHDASEQLLTALDLSKQHTEQQLAILHLRTELHEARRQNDEAWAGELEDDLQEAMAKLQDDPSPSETDSAQAALPLQLSQEELASAASLDFDTVILPMLRATCFECHDSSQSSGELNLEALVEEQPFVINRSDWLNVIEQLKVGSMPPADAEQPTESDRRMILGWLTHSIDNFDYSTVSSAGWVPAKRLTHDEYNNTIRDLVGIDLKPADQFPADLTASSGFDNSANTLFLHSTNLERYIGAAEAIVQSAWPLEPTSIEHERARALLFQGVQDLNEEGAGPRVILRFATRAFRRPLEQEEADSLLAFYHHRLSQGDSIEVAIREVLQVILISPNFLLRTEDAPNEAGLAESVSDWELASRLSYFLWATMPDEELFELAHAGRLHQEEVLAQQVERMLADPKAETLGSLFAAQWLGFTDLDRVQRDQIDNPWATDSLVAAMKAESAMLFHSLVQRNSSIDRLLDADYTFLNEELAKHYEIDGVQGDEMREVSLSQTPRRGILGHGSILAITSLPSRTSPVIRGNWILTTLLGTPPPPPPPNVSDFDEQVANNQRLTQRQRLELHRTKPNCFACHSQIDPLGFALEEFEWFGRYRPQQGNASADALGTLPSGTSFRGLMGLSETLLNERRADLAEQLVRKMLAYALGRQLDYHDEATVQQLVAHFEANERRMQSLIHGLVHTDCFLKKQIER